MANPIPGMEAVDIGGGEAATYFDDGSVQFWWISGPSAGQASRPPTGPDPNVAIAAQQSMNLGGPGGPVYAGPAPRISPTGGVTITPTATPPPAPGSSLPQARLTWGTGAPVNMNWVYDLVQTPQGWQPVRRGPQTNWQNQPIPDSDQSQEANYTRRQAGVPQALAQYVTPGQGLFGVTENAGEAGAAFLRPDNPNGSGLSTGIDNYTPAAFQDFITRYQAGKIYPKNAQAKQLGDAIVAGQITAQQLAGMANSPMTGGGLTPGAAGGAFGAAGAANAGGIGGTGGGNDAYSQLLAQQNASASAAQAAQLAYQNAILKHYSDQDALAAAEFAYKQEYESKIFEYQKSQDAQNLAVTQAGLTGTYQGQPTVQEQQRQFANAVTQAGLTGMYNGQPTFAAQQANNATAMSLLNMNAQLSGPSNYLTYLRTLSNTPQGLTDIVNSLAGQFKLSSLQGQVPGSGFERQSVGTLARDLNDATRPGSTMDASGAVLPSGSQWNAQNFSILAKNPTQLGLTKNLYQESGRDWSTEYANFLSSLPRFGGPQQGGVSLA